MNFKLNISVFSELSRTAIIFLAVLIYLPAGSWSTSGGNATPNGLPHHGPSQEGGEPTPEKSSQTLITRVFSDPEYSGGGGWNSCALALSPLGGSWRGAAPGGLVILCKIYTEGVKLHYSDKATNVTVKIAMTDEKKSNTYAVRSNGRFTTELELNKRYMICISKEGFETKCFKLSTDKVFPNDRHYLAFNIILKKEKAADYDRRHPIASIEYNAVNNSFECTILQKSGSSKSEPLLSDPHLTNRWSF